MRKDFFKKNMIIAAVLLMVVCLSGCKIKLAEISASVMAKLNIPDIYAMERRGWSNTSTLRSVYQQTFDDDRQRVDKVIDDYFQRVYDMKHDTKNAK